MKILLIDNGTRFKQALKRLLYPHPIIVRKWNKLTHIKFEQYDVIVLSGGHSLSVKGHEKNWKDEIETIRTCHTPIIGICLGFELIATAFGAKLKLLKSREKGVISIQNIGKQKLLPKKNIQVYESHRWAVEKLPPKLLGLARSRDGIEAFKHRQKPIFALQFHPEKFVRKTDGKMVFKRILDTLS